MEAAYSVAAWAAGSQFVHVAAERYDGIAVVATASVHGVVVAWAVATGVVAAGNVTVADTVVVVVAAAVAVALTIDPHQQIEENVAEQRIALSVATFVSGFVSSVFAVEEFRCFQSLVGDAAAAAVAFLVSSALARFLG